MSEGKGKKRYIACCGLYCGDFPWYTGQIADAFLSAKKYWFSVIKTKQ